MTNEATAIDPAIVEALAVHTPLWGVAQRRFVTVCGCGNHQLFGVTREEAEQRWGTHLAGALAPLIAAAVERAKAEAWEGGAAEGLRTPLQLGYTLTNPYRTEGGADA